MRKLFLSLLSLTLAASLLCACTNRQLGTVGGAALGGVAGSALTGGSAAGTVAGAVGGGLIGYGVTR